jgi:NDP-sugar pyrophosphorylase family protein
VKENVSRYQIREYWLDIGQVEDYSKAREAYNEHFNGNTVSSPDEAVAY